eukprot:GGOE01037175.1.p1 GENE.GGOE01037175.1~~GGOE01037175.1.p1  ORF type:complete len:464 (-),score=102.48 GGOE01037175.1:219-1610(-)
MSHKPRYPIESGPAYFQRWDKYDADDAIKRLDAEAEMEGTDNEPPRRTATEGPPRTAASPPPGNAEDVLLTVARKHRIDPELLLACQQTIRLTLAEIGALPAGEQMRATAIRTSATFERERLIVRELELQQFITQQCCRTPATQQAPPLPPSTAPATPADALAEALDVEVQRIHVCAHAMRLAQSEVALLPEASQANLRLVRCDPAFASLRNACRRLGLVAEEDDSRGATADVEGLLSQLAADTAMPLEVTRTAVRCLHMSEVEVGRVVCDADRATASLIKSAAAFHDLRCKARRLGLLPEGSTSAAPILFALGESVDFDSVRALPAPLGQSAPVETLSDISSALDAGVVSEAPECAPAGDRPAVSASHLDAMVPSTHSVTSDLQEPKYSVEGTAACLTITVDLPLLTDMSSVSLDMEEGQLRLTTPAEYLLVVPLPGDMSDHNVQAKFHKKHRRLVVTLSEA